MKKSMIKRFKYLFLPIAVVLIFIGIFSVGASEASAVGTENESWKVLTLAGEKTTENENRLTSPLTNPVMSRYCCYPPSQGTGGIQIIKYDSRTNARLSGAQFTIYDRYNRVVQVITSDLNGIAQTKTLPLGTYTVVETKAPTGYQLERTAMCFSLKYYGQLICFTKCNVQIPVQKGCIQVTKKDEAGRVLSGAVFEVYDSANKLVGTITTNYYGVATLGNLPYGTYKIIEIKAPAGYTLDSTPREVKLSSGAACITIINKKQQQGCLQIIKKDEAGKLLAGAVFEVYDSANKLVGTITTNSNGVATLGNLPYGTYKIIEIKAPAGYELDSTPKQMTVSSGTACITIINKKQQGKLEVIKKDDQGTLLSGAKFEVYDSTNKLVGTITTGANGVATLGNLPYGEYKIVEIEAPAGYVLDSAPKYVTVSKDNPNGVAKLEVENKKAVGTLEIVKINTEDEKLSGAKFEVYDSTNKLVGTITTDANGVATLGNLPYGEYKIVEIEAPAGYVLDSAPKYVTVSETNPNGIVTLKVTNEKEVTEGSLKIIKYVHESDPVIYLPGAVFEVYNADVELIGTYTTNAQGEILLEGLTPGDYYVVEKEAPLGYQEDTTFYHVTVVANETAEVRHPNVPIENKGSLKITKYANDTLGDPTTTKLPGAEFDVVDSEGTVHKVVTGSNGEVILTDLPLGTVTVTETKAPDKYSIGSTPTQTTEIVAGETKELNYYNNPIGEGRAIIYVNCNDKSVSNKGLNFVITDEQGNTRDVVTNSFGQISIYLPAGKYKINQVIGERSGEVSPASDTDGVSFNILGNKLTVVNLTI